MLWYQRAAVEVTSFSSLFASLYVMTPPVVARNTRKDLNNSPWYSRSAPSAERRCARTRTRWDTGERFRRRWRPMHRLILRNEKWERFEEDLNDLLNLSTHPLRVA
ncbi:uncharacterized protein EV422DRAFT_516235 [Fimicolochytrium jonesii]|uniref:uncharacterized protein n=1 Tax=Fimicolochytrium jonesii TaxID=1396493 RepID=UPI0022FEF932|nr:uncharacterized protein EV422DRAFT_516235 [Fimicolochytrium jonesii]KAI8824801.1 hypothetical protein EV422DRAFT_516235 [Fimicolochytrium jonesii]